MPITPEPSPDPFPPPARPGAEGSSVAEAYAHCLGVARDHYENFPVASRLVPRDLRGPVAAVYAFARLADDFADEPRHAGSRMALLDDWGDRLERAVAGEARDPVFIALADTARRFHLPPDPFRDLLSAFRQDALKSRYQDWEEVLDYCRRSANPVGRLVLLLFGHREESLVPLSDSLCSALQLTNFWQDLAVDARRGRLYVPRDDRDRHGVPEAAFFSEEAPRLPGFLPLMDEMVTRTEALFERGRDLPDRIRGRLGFELRLTWLGGRRILAATRSAGFNVYRARPSLGRASWLPLLLRACFRLAPERGG